MSKLQKVILILVAFGVVSIVMSQASDNYLEKVDNSTIMIGYNDNKPSVNTVVINANYEKSKIDAKSHSNQQKSIDNKALNTDSQIVTNIYQTTNGSFYFEALTQETSQHNASIENKKDEPDSDDEVGFIPSYLASTDAKVTIAGPIARTKLTQTFNNQTNQVRSGVYVFPLPDDAAVDSLKMKIGDRQIIGEIKRKHTAHKMFTEAKIKGKKASLISQIRPNMFTSRVANIPANSTIEITIEYQQLVRHENSNFSLRLPLSITPRYQPSNAEQPDLTQLDPRFMLQPYLDTNTNIQVDILSGIPVTDIESEHHPISITNDQQVYKIHLDTNKPANKDFVLNWSLQQGLNIQADHLRYSDENYDYGLITLLSPELVELNSPRQILFVLDVSGSMVGESLTQAKKAIALAINDLGDNDHFNLISFHSQADSLFKSSKKANVSNKEQALNYLYHLEANGGTEIKRALELVFKHKEIEGALNQILFVTDGSVSNEHELLGDIDNNLGDFRLFTVGIGNAPNSYFMTESAYVGKGSYTFVGDISNVETKMNTLLNKLKHPSLTNLRLNFEDPEKAFEFEIYPAILPDLYTRELLQISYRKNKSNKYSDLKITETQATNEDPTELLNDLSTLRINGEFFVETTEQDLVLRNWSNSLPFYDIKNASGLDKHWARQKIKSLTNKRYKTQTIDALESKKYVDNINEQITQVALQYSLVSEFTSLVAIDNTPLEKREKQVPNREQLSARMTRLPQTSTNSFAYVFSGISMICVLLFFNLNSCKAKQPIKDN